MAAVLAAGCLSLTRSYPEKHAYVLDAGREGGGAAAAPGPVLRVMPFRASPAFAGRGFVYRTADDEYRADFYNEFFAPPDRLVTEEVRQWLGASGLFGTVVSSAAQVEADYALEGVVSALYGDYREPGAPRAVLKLEMLLVADPLTDPRVAKWVTCEETAALDDVSPAALVRGWNEALRRALQALELAMAEADLTPAP
ncbi:MAG: hypothetical protein AMK73_00420 [Planctomycetes bacterium SM23_32]|nr:MAG: hypothetical protein AMK73_00420 [Planctomycetes bacterium SM23_32]